MVAITHTVVDVRAMMIESLDTLVADVAVSAARRPDSLTVRAQVESFHLIKQLLEVNMWTSLHVTRINKRCQTERQYQYCCKQH